MNSFINFGLIDLVIFVINPLLKEWDENLWPKTSCIKILTFLIKVELLGICDVLPFTVVFGTFSRFQPKLLINDIILMIIGY